MATFKVGRNAPCPCGSGKKYKKCCGFGRRDRVSPIESQSFRMEIFRKIAYSGSIGEQRKKFCEASIGQRKKQIEETIILQKQKAKELNEEIQCHKGCYYCCAQHIGGSLQESEIIVYYLYHNEDAFNMFIEQYPAWREAVRINENLFQAIGTAFTRMASSGFNQKHREMSQQLGNLYFAQNIFCPFLNNHECLIYDVRPKVCSALVSTSNPGWCDPSNDNKPELITLDLDIDEPRYFYGPQDKQVYATIPLLVYEIINGSYFYLSDIPGFEGIERDAFSDKEVSGAIKLLKG